MNTGFLIKIIPPKGYDVYRFHVSRVAALSIALVALVAILGALGVHAWQLHVAEDNVRSLQARTDAQQQTLGAIDRQADSLATQLKRLERENERIRHLLGVGPAVAAPKPRSSHTARAVATPTFADVEGRLKALAFASTATTLDQKHLEQLTKRVLNTRRLAEIARTRLIAALPSINPVGGGIAAAFGWRTDPWPEFHRGLDLEADYGAPVHAAADGVVVSAGWDGGFGNKVDIDHGNGYHTWYAHLSRFGASVGEHVRKGETIAFVGATGEATGPHLHYQVMHDGEAIDPMPFLNGVPRTVLATLPAAGRVQ